MNRKDVRTIYNLPEQIKFCKRCVMSNQRPRITFDEYGVCNACNYVEKVKSKINWEEREKELLDLLAQHRSKDGSFDVIVPSSGGKDSVFVAHLLKYKYNMNPLTVTWSPNIYTKVGWWNFQALIKAGLPNILGSADGKVQRKLVRECFIEMGEPLQPFIYGQILFPFQIAIKYGIQLIMNGENAELEYGGDSKVSEKDRFKNLTEELSKYLFPNWPIERWLEKGFTRQDLSFYFSTPIKTLMSSGLQQRLFSYYRKWIPKRNYYYAVEKVGFRGNPDGRSEGTYSGYASLDDCLDGFHYYLMYIKFGIGRATSDVSHEIRDGYINRQEAVELVRKYDGEFPQKYFKDFLEYCDMDEGKFWEVIDSWRSPHIWEKVGKEYKLRYQVS